MIAQHEPDIGSAPLNYALIFTANHAAEELMTVPTPHAGDVQSLCRRYGDALTPTSQPIVGLKEMSAGFLLSLAAGIVTGAVPSARPRV